MEEKKGKEYYWECGFMRCDEGYFIGPPKVVIKEAMNHYLKYHYTEEMIESLLDLLDIKPWIIGGHY